MKMSPLNKYYFDKSFIIDTRFSGRAYVRSYTWLPPGSIPLSNIQTRLPRWAYSKE